MPDKVYINGRRLEFDPDSPFAEGKEAYLYRITSGVGAGKALKVFKQEEDFASAKERESVRPRLLEYRQKLPAFPRKLPETVIRPQELVWDEKGQMVLGYTMTYIDGATRLSSYANQRFRTEQKIGDWLLAPLFRSLHKTISSLHEQNVIIGDFTDANVLVRKNSVHLVDADSFQFGWFLCRLWTVEFVDPRLLGQDKESGNIRFAGQHDKASDWYAYTVMLMKCTVYADPYAGIPLPGNPTKQLERRLGRLTIFDPRVKRPLELEERLKAAPTELIEYFRQVFSGKWPADPFPQAHLHSFERWCRREQERKGWWRFLAAPLGG